jgi:cystathionine beta-lyase/cystathionine gamma-synthase
LKSYGQATNLIHSSHKPDPQHGAVMPSIVMTSTFAQSEPGVHKGYDYTRAGNPNFDQAERGFSALEGAQHATVFSSGLAATTALLSTLSSGDHVMALNGLYGGTFRLFKKVYEKFGVQFSFVSVEQLEEALSIRPKFLFFESPTNPLLGIVDIEAVCRMARSFGVQTVVDNTFATPIFQNPLDLGADVVLHSTTKYINGHSDVVGGVVITNSAELKEQLDLYRMAVGLNPSPFDSWLTMRGARTLKVRMEAHQKNALRIAGELEKHPLVKRVIYPGLPSHPQHEIAKKQMKGFSGIVSVEFDLPLEAAKKVVSSFKLFTLAESLGGVESLVCHPASMTHASIPKKERERIGLSDGLMRFSVGIEDCEDLLEDLLTTLEKTRSLQLQ